MKEYHRIWDLYIVFSIPRIQIDLLECSKKFIGISQQQKILDNRYPYSCFYSRQKINDLYTNSVALPKKKYIGTANLLKTINFVWERIGKNGIIMFSGKLPRSEGLAIKQQHNFKRYFFND